MSASFLDSNVLVYLFDETGQRKRGIARNLVKEALETEESMISFQVVQETLNVLRTKLPTPLTVEQAEQFLNSTLMPLWKVYPSRELYQRGLSIQDRYQFGFYDSLIIAARAGSRL